MKCPNCNKNKAIIHPIFGVSFCEKCQRIKLSAGQSTEFTTESIRDQRLEYKKDILQPFRDGVLSREYLDTYGTSGIQVTRQEVKTAKYTNSHEKGWWNYKKGKGGRNFKPKIETVD